MQQSKNYEPTEQEWHQLARQARDEKDPEKMIGLTQQIVEAYQKAKSKTRTAILWPKRD